ncbi:MAG: sugar phosphate isomerase/epimerase family protein [Isosphaeraceae bacterium]
MPLQKSLSFRGLGLAFPGIDQAAKLAASAGFDALDLPVRDLYESHISPTHVRKLLASHALAIGACPFPLDWRSSESAFRHTIQNLPAYTDYALGMGIEKFYTRVSESVDTHETAENTIAWHLDRLGQIAELLQKNSLRLAFETVGVASFRQGRLPLMPTLTAVKHHLAPLFRSFPNTGLLVDAFHLHASAESLEAATGGFENRIFGVHVADLPGPTPPSQIIDNVRALPGTSSVVPVRAILAGLVSNCISAPVMVETVSNPLSHQGLTEVEIVGRVAASLRDVFPAGA